MPISKLAEPVLKPVLVTAGKIIGLLRHLVAPQPATERAKLAVQALEVGVA